MNRDFEGFKQWWSKAKRTLKCDQYDTYEIWQASQKVAVPDGWVVVPKEPTEEMYLRGTQAILELDLSDIYDKDSIHIYKAMIEAQEQN